LRAFRHLIELRDELSELSNLFLEFAAGSHTPPLRTFSESGCHGGTVRMALFKGAIQKGNGPSEGGSGSDARRREYEPGLHRRQVLARLMFSVRSCHRLYGSTPEPTPNIGEWWVSSTFPLPRYMWTPQGRQGSKLRTARMMSMPLNLSGPFSSKIGVFCTASS
jgi:hypothetical protein